MHALQHGRSARARCPAPRSATQQRLSRGVMAREPRPGRRHCPVLAANGEPVAVGLMGGRVLLLPNVNPQAASSSPAAPMPVPTQQPTDLWGAFGSRVSKGGLVRLQDLVGACSSQSAPTTTLLVIYAPWCPHCRAMEAEVDKLAAATAGQVQVVAVRGDTPATRRFIKEELQVNSLPALLLFPAQSRMYFRYRSPHRDALSLQRFIHNMTALTAPSAAPSAAAEAPGHLAQQASAAVSIQAVPTATAATGVGGHHHVSASLAAVRQQLEQVVSNATTGAVPAAVTLTEVKGQMVGLAAVMGISLAVAQTVSNNSISSSSSSGSGSGAATGEQQELDGNIRNVVNLLQQLLTLKAALVWADLQQRLAPLLAHLAPLTPVAPGDTTEASSSSSSSGSGMLAGAVELSQTPALAVQGAAPQLLLPAAVAAVPMTVSTAAPVPQQQQEAVVAAAGKVAAFRSARQYKALPPSATPGTAEISGAGAVPADAAAAAGGLGITQQQAGAAAGAAATLAALASSTQQLQALATTLDQLDEAQLAQAMTAQLPGQQQEAALTHQEVAVSAADAAALLDVLLAAQGGQEEGATAGRGKVDSRQLQQLLEELLEKDGQLRA